MIKDKRGNAHSSGMLNGNLTALNPSNFMRRTCAQQPDVLWTYLGFVVKTLEDTKPLAHAETGSKQRTIRTDCCTLGPHTENSSGKNVKAECEVRPWGNEVALQLLFPPAGRQPNACKYLV